MTIQLIKETIEEMVDAQMKSYFEGVRRGIKMCAYEKNGTLVVGNGILTLDEVLAQIDEAEKTDSK